MAKRTPTKRKTAAPTKPAAKQKMKVIDLTKGENLPAKRQRPVPPGKTPWAVQVMERLAKKLAREAENGPESREGKCSAMTTGTYGPKRPCDRYAIAGGTVCIMHGGSTKNAKKAARERLLDEVDPTISRLRELRDQDAHLPTALGAATHILNRALGKPENADKGGERTGPVINVGIAIGGIPVKGNSKIGSDGKMLPDSVTVNGDVIDADQ